MISGIWKGPILCEYNPISSACYIHKICSFVMNRTVAIDYSDELLQTLDMSPEQFQEEARMLLAVRLYEMGSLSTGAAAEFVGTPKTTFLTRMSEYGIEAFNYPAEELEQDVANAQRHL